MHYDHFKLKSYLKLIKQIRIFRRWTVSFNVSDRAGNNPPLSPNSVNLLCDHWHWSHGVLAGYRHFYQYVYVRNLYLELMVSAPSLVISSVLMNAHWDYRHQFGNVRRLRAWCHKTARPPPRQRSAPFVYGYADVTLLGTLCSGALAFGDFSSFQSGRQFVWKMWNSLVGFGWFPWVTALRWFRVAGKAPSAGSVTADKVTRRMIRCPTVWFRTLLHAACRRPISHRRQISQRKLLLYS